MKFLVSLHSDFVLLTYWGASLVIWLKHLKLYLPSGSPDEYKILTLTFVSLQVLQNILDTEKDYAKELQSLLVTYLRPLQSNNK